MTDPSSIPESHEWLGLDLLTKVLEVLYTVRQCVYEVTVTFVQML